MTSNLEFFYKFYQTIEISQDIDFSKIKDQYLLPKNHQFHEQIQAAAAEIKPSQGEDERTLTTRVEGQSYLKCMNEAPGWLLRAERDTHTCGGCIGNAQGSPESSQIVRVVMNDYLKKKVKEQGLDVIIPTEYLVEAHHPYRRELNPLDYEDFFVVSERLNILGEQEGINRLHSFDPSKQKEVAETICRLIYHSGYMDAHTNNIVLTSEDKIAIVDTEGQSLFHDVNREPNYKPTSLSSARIIGLEVFISQGIERMKLPETFAQTAKTYLFFARVMEVVRTVTIFLSVICPLIPLVVLICSFISAKVF